MAGSAAMGPMKTSFLKCSLAISGLGGGGRGEGGYRSCLFTDKCGPPLLSHKAPHSGDPQILDKQRGGSRPGLDATTFCFKN